MFRLFFILCLALAGRQLTAQFVVRGNITDAAGNPLIGVNVSEKGTLHGAVSDLQGAYVISLQSGESILLFSYTGYQTLEVVVAGQTSLNVTLQEGVSLNEVRVVGSRSYRRSSTDSPVPIDVIDIASVGQTFGKVEINQMLQYAAPSFNATKQSGSDGADHIDPASLRGLGPDQTLVLVNGKRRHQSSLINVFGTRGRGNSGTDLNALPSAAIKRIEILRDGSSAQYGSDAIAGVINIVLEDQTEGLNGGLTYGAYSTGIGEGYEEQAGDVLYNIEGRNRIDGKETSFDGNTLKLDLNYGLPVGDHGGYVNFTTEYLDKDRTLRPGWSWRKGYGTAAVDGFNFMVNAAVPIADQTEFYAFGGRNFRNTDAYAFSRDSYASGDNRTVASLYPDGFSPHITSAITDVSAVAGIRHTLRTGWEIDFSHAFGRNNFHYYITGTNNASMGVASPTAFDAGGHNLSQNTTNLDFSKYFDHLGNGFNLAFGLEYRTENFQIFAGDESSYAIYDTTGRAILDPVTQVPAIDDQGNPLPGGAQGFPGYSPANVVNESRSNVGLYLDGELDITKAWMVSGALRYEDYSDFGETFNFKAATRYALSDRFALRGSVSSGFRAPSLAQIHYNLSFNNIVGGMSLPSLLSSNTSPVTRAFGIGPLQQETAFNASLGFTLSLGDFSATIDAYSIAVNDRIVLTDNFDASGLNLGVDVAQFFANGVDTRTQGLDFVLAYRKAFAKSSNLVLSLAGNVNHLEIDKINNGDLNEYTFFGPFSQAYLKAAAPDYKFVLGATYSVAKFDFAMNLTQFSRVRLQDFQWIDTPATNAEEADALRAVATDVYDPALTFDLSAAVRLRRNLRLTVGANNLFNVYPTPQFDGWTDQGGFNDSVQMGADGAYFFGRIGFSF